MFNKLKTLFELKTDRIPDVQDMNELATKGIDLNSLITVDYPLLDLTPSLIFSLGDKTKKITGKSSASERGEHTHRFYTEDDYFFQFDFFGENKRENLNRLAVFSYLLDEGEAIVPGDEAAAARWRQLIEDKDTYTYAGQIYQRITSGVLGGLEVVELVGDDLNTLENNFAVFAREISDDFFEFLIINMEQEVSVDDDDNVSGYGDMTATMAIGVSIPHSQLTVNPNQGK
ncbi:hypothetical protein VA7868_00192 [Vibrio aerogenes CECT 7868]|uniref:DUF2491 domain-containing protein n=1 Tax=Vibrio aerogenes CECT 7868 TaxID=1216006 RepID=A0A1M5UVY7_9VIBR|nr:DUF2491 family protein [Vibrio aerogenes]SHH67152.1 hypothetical protein VA7868_00192 [Vibrio aerogenes CECT 7868]